MQHNLDFRFETKTDTKYLWISMCDKNENIFQWIETRGEFFGMSGRRSSRSAFSGRLVTMLVATVNNTIFSCPFFSPSSTFLIEGMLWSNHLFRKRLMGAPKNQEVGTYSDPISHFGAPLQPFWIFEVLIEGMIESKDLLSKSCSGGQIT